MAAPALAVFDVNETVFSLDRLGQRLEDAGLPEGALQVWFARVLRDGFALAAVGDYQPFRQLATTHLRGVLREHGRGTDDDAVAHVFDGFSTLDAHPDVAPAFDRLRGAGVRIVTLTNGHADTTVRLLERNGLRGDVERCLSVDDVKLWKPRPEPYLHTVRSCDVAVGDAAMIAVHSWDVDGAKRAGMRTAYASRLEGAFVDGFTPPDAQGDDLIAAVDVLLR